MVRLSSILTLLGLLGTPLVAAAFNETEQNENATCDNKCFFSSFNGSCANDATCMCDQTKYRETYFCCLGKKCASSVLPDAIVRQESACEAWNMPFTFDALAVCGINLTTSTTVSTSATSTNTASSAVSTASTASAASATSATASAVSSTGTSAASSTNASASTSTASKTSTGTSTSTPTGNGASANKVMLNAVVGIVAVSVMLS